MSVRTLFRAILSAILLLLAAGPALVRSSQSGEPREPAAESASPGASAPWIIDETDTVGDTGQYMGRCAALALEQRITPATTRVTTGCTSHSD